MVLAVVVLATQVLAAKVSYYLLGYQSQLHFSPDFVPS
jgi:hypothetical protein